MGTVFLARAPTGRFVAVKVVKAEFANQEGFAASFHAEVENARRVASFCTAQVLDNGNTGDGRPYMVTEYIAGTPLSDQITEYGALDPGPLHGVALGVAAALAAIHVAGLVHRDLKPANVILSLSGPRVIDFGIARALDGATAFTLRASCSAAPAGGRPSRSRPAGHPGGRHLRLGLPGRLRGQRPAPFRPWRPHHAGHPGPAHAAGPRLAARAARRAGTARDRDGPGQRPTAQELLLALVGGGAKPAPATDNPPTLVADELLTDWEPPQNVVDKPDITATFATPPPSDTTAKGPAVATDVSQQEPQPQQADLQELARREEQAAREELARWEVPTPQKPIPKQPTPKKPKKGKNEQARLAEQAPAARRRAGRAGPPHGPGAPGRGTVHGRHPGPPPRPLPQHPLADRGRGGRWRPSP